MTYVCCILNHTYNDIIKNTPLNASAGSTCDTSPLLRFRFWQPIYFNMHESSFSIKTAESRGRFVGISKPAGHHMTHKILNTSINKIIHRSEVCPADKEESANLRSDPLTTKDVVKAR